MRGGGTSLLHTLGNRRTSPGAAGSLPTPTPQARPESAGLAEAIERLRPKYRRCIKLRYVEQRSYDDIADLMHVSREAVCNWLNRARKELKEALHVEPPRSVNQ